VDEYGWYEQCMMCGYLCSLEGLSYVCGAEEVIVTRQGSPKFYPFRSVIETLKQAMRAKMEEAREYIVAELSHGALEKRQLRLRMLTRGIIKYTFDAALKELKDAGVVMALATGKGKRKKLVLTAESA
jgi:hypothetical protein